MRFSSIQEVLQEGAALISPAIFEGQELKSLIWSALDDTNKWHKRHCVLQAPIVFSGVLAMTMFRSSSIVNAFKRVLDAARGLRNVPLKDFTDEAIYHARARLGAEPLKQVARELGAQMVPPPSFLGFIPCAMDGVKLTIPDTPENVAQYGRHKNGRGDAGYPQIGAVALIYADTRKVIDCVWGRHTLSELAAAEQMLSNLGPEHILFLDRRYTKIDLWLQIVERGIHMVHRLSKVYDWQIKKRLGKGDYLVEVDYQVVVPSDEPRQRQRLETKSRTMRVIEYEVNPGETARVITDLLDPKLYPALEIALGYHLRWEIELVYDEWQTHLATVGHGTQHTVFRSQTPEGVLQEAWALVVTYNLVRGLMLEAAQKHDIPPLEISFVDTLEVIRMALPQLQSCQTHRMARTLYLRMLRDIAHCRLKRPRRKRVAPRVVKVKMSKFPRKRSGDESRQYDFARALRMVDQTWEAA